ncbi:RDD family protein [Bacillus subtilis]|uniref:RDD family protein n=1 Tax=Bacillus subtilis TaxID=1423 RepID=UPI002DD0E328|nr:RDD family protein [Bacillus subtilis]
MNRAAASIIDVFIIAIFSFIMIFINTFIVLPLIDAAGTHMSEAQYEFFMLIIGTIPVLAIIFIFAILYYSLLTSSNMQATLGKKTQGHHRCQSVWRAYFFLAQLRPFLRLHII